MADKERHKIRNLLMKLNDEDRNAPCCLLIKAGYAARIGKAWIPKSIARKPVARTGTYLKYGFVVTECEKYLCPRCGDVLNAGPNYQPEYCNQCGQKVSFKGIGWKEEKELGFVERREGHEQVENRVV